MYRQRKRDLNLKPNRQLDKRSSRGMIYENEELRMRTIAICEDVDRGQSDIKKIRKENDHLKREIWGLRDECEKLEEMLKKVCISANIPKIELESTSSKTDNDDEDDDDDNDDEDQEDDEGSNLDDDDDVPPDKYLKTGGSSSRRKRRTSGASVGTFDSEIGSYISNMFDDGINPQQQQQQLQHDHSAEEIAFAAEDPGSVILNPMAMASASSSSEPVAGTSASSAVIYQSWTAPYPAAAPDLEVVREESESNLNSPASPLPPGDSNLVSLIHQPYSTEEENYLTSAAAAASDDRKTPVIQITPASSPTSNSTNETANSFEMDLPLMEQEIVQSAGCITVVPKTFTVTSEIEVGNANEDDSQQQQETPSMPPLLARSVVEAPTRRGFHLSSPSYSSAHHPNSDRRSCYYYPTTTGSMPAQSLSSSNLQNYGGVLGYCCCNNNSSSGNNNNDLLLGGCQSEPSLLTTSQTTDDGHHHHHHHTNPNAYSSATSFFNTFCCRGGPPHPHTFVAAPAVTLRSMWNTVDKNLVIGFYGYTTTTAATATAGGGSESGNLDHFTSEPKVQDIIDRLETEFDPTLENILGIRLIPPGRVFISLKNATVVKSFLSNFKNDLVLINKQNLNNRVRIHFIEGATTKLTTTLILSGIPPELSDLAVISSLNQFGQVVAPLERRNYKGIDISERIAKMHLVVTEGSVPEYINVSGYEVRITRAEEKLEMEQQQQVSESSSRLTHGQQQAAAPPIILKQPQRKYGFIDPTTVTSVATTTNPVVPSAAAVTVGQNTVGGGGQGLTSVLKAHKPVTRSCSSAPRLETPVPGTLTCPLPPVEQKRQSSVCVGNIPSDQHPSKLIKSGGSNVAVQQQQHQQQQQQQLQQKVTIAQQQTQTSSVPNLQPPAKKPLARLLVSSPGSLPQSPVSSPGSPADSNMQVYKTGKDGPFKNLYRSFDSNSKADRRGHQQVTPSSSYSPKNRRKSSTVQFTGKGGKREPLPWCGCWGLGCG